MKIESRDGPTPAGGVRSTAAYLNDDWELVDKADATQVEITEYDELGKIIMTTVGRVGGPTTDEPTEA